MNQRTLSEPHSQKRPILMVLKESDANAANFWCRLKGALSQINSGLQLVCLVPVGLLIGALISQVAPELIVPLYVIMSFAAYFVFMAASNTVSALLSDRVGFIVLLVLSLTVIVPFLAGVARVLLTPCLVSISKDGLREYFVNAELDLFIKTPWNRIVMVHAAETCGGGSSVCFTSANGATILLPSRMLTTVEERANLLEAITQWAPHVVVDETMLKELARTSPYPSYTELWLDAVTGEAARKRTTPLTGQTFLQSARFTIQRKIGAGGQAIAYLAELNDVGMFGCPDGRSKQVVLKEFILPDYNNWRLRKEAIARMQHEATMLMKLNSPNIVKLLDFFIEDHRGYLVLEHIEGRTLRQIVERGGPLPERLARNSAIQMCDILIYLHGQTPSVVHRDFTPDNLILTKDGKLKLIDFNVAQEELQAESLSSSKFSKFSKFSEFSEFSGSSKSRGSSKSSHSKSSGSSMSSDFSGYSDFSRQTAVTVGKPSYMPPEQLRGEPVPASDIYAMGMTLAFLFIGEDPEPLEQVWLRQFRPEISETMHKIVLGATAQDLERRWSSLEEAREALSKFPE